MATTKLWKVTDRLDHIIDYVYNIEKTSSLIDTVHYVSNEEKTLQRRYVTCINCDENDPCQSMNNTKKMSVFMGISHFWAMKYQQIWLIK